MDLSSTWVLIRTLFGRVQDVIPINKLLILLLQPLLVWGLGFRVWGLGFGVWGSGFGVWGLGFRV